MIAKILNWLGVKEQLRKDLVALVAVVMAYVNKAEDQHGSGTGQAKRAQALDDFFTSVAEEGGLEVPSWCTGQVARLVVGALIDFLVSVANGEKPGN